MAYAQPGAKRQKVREGRGDGEYFHGIDVMEYKSTASPSETGCYRYYNATERVHSRSMEDWLKCSVSLSQFRSDGDNHSRPPPPPRPWDDASPLESCKRRVRALFELCSKLGVKYWTALDSELVAGEGWEETRTAWEEVADLVLELQQRSHTKLLWLAPDLHSQHRYASGALTSSDATVFVQAASQIKKCLEMSQRLGAECFLLWPRREGYDSIFQTDVAREIKLFSKLLKMTAEYKERLNYRCQLLIMPYYGYGGKSDSGFDTWQYQGWREEDRVNAYMWDVTSCLYFLKNYNLDRYYKVCTPPGHHMYMANVYNMLGGVVITNRRSDNDNKNLTLMMKCIIDQGTTLPGGVSLRVRARECEPRELVAGCARRVDALARALRVAATLAADQLFSKHVQQRYTTYYSGFGARIASGDVSLEECEELHKKNPSHAGEPSRAEHCEAVLQRYLDTCDHV